MLTTYDWLFSDPFFHTPSFFPFAHEPRRTTHNLAAHETDEGLEVELEVPRFRAEDIKLTTDVDRGIVTIEGHRPAPQLRAHATHTDSSVASFRRSFTVSPRDFDVSKLSSQVSDGVLVIRIPYQPEPESPKLTQGTAHATNVAIAGTPAPAASSTAVATTGNAAGSLQSWPPKLVVAEKPSEGVAVRFDYALPEGVKPENVHVQVLDNGSLRVDVSHKVKHQDEHSFEERSASFTRYFPLPKGTKPEEVHAAFEDGHLKVSVQEHK